MLSIGDFARAAGVSIRMLRHYDQIGLLRPSRVDPSSGYRFYDQSLLARANALVALKDLGFSLEQVRAMLDRDVSAADLRRLLTERRAELERQIEDDLGRLADVERRLRLMEGRPTMELEFTEQALPAIQLVQLSTIVDDQSEIGDHVGPMFERLAEALTKAGTPPGHPGIAWYDAVGDGMRVAVGFADRPADGIEGASVGQLPVAPRAVVATYKGSMEHIGEAWQSVAAHITDSGLAFAGPCREAYLNTVGPQEDWVTELQQPVA